MAFRDRFDERCHGVDPAVPIAGVGGGAAGIAYNVGTLFHV
jgi:hypothetical protein